jgi:hypothetical protein
VTNNSLDERWDEFIASTKKNGHSCLGRCMVDMMIVNDNVCLMLTDDLGVGLEMMLDSKSLPPEAKATLMLFHKAFKKSYGDNGGETSKDVLIEGYEDFLLPRVSEELREIVKDIESIDVVLSLMCYIDMISEAMMKHDVEEVSLGRNGDIYVDDDMPYTSDEIFSEIKGMTDLDDDEILTIMKWVPLAAMDFEGTFPGMESTPDGFAAKVKSVDPYLSSSFSAAMIDMLENEEEIIITPIDMSLLSRIKSADEQFQFYSSRKRTPIPVDDFIKLMSLEGAPSDEINLIRTTLINIFNAAGQIVDFQDLRLIDDEEVMEMVVESICNTIDRNRGNKDFMWSYGSEGIMFCKKDDNDEEGER